MDNSRKSYLFAFKAFGDFGITIAVPAVLAALAGKWLDIKFGSYPKCTILLLTIAFVLTAIILVRKVKQYGKEYEDLINQK